MAQSDEEIASFKRFPKVNIYSRFYRELWPRKDDIVMVQVKNVSDTGAYVSLLEYNNIEGLITPGELSRRRIRSVNKLTRIGKQEVVTVLRVDKERGFIDLSKKNVVPEEISECELRYNKGKLVHSILRNVAEHTNTDINILYENIAWPLYDKYQHAFDAFTLAVTQPDLVFEGLNMTDEVRQNLVQNINNRLTPHKVQIRADFVVTCFQYEGIEAIRAALLAGKALSNDKFNISIKLIAAPIYVLIMSTHDRNEGLEVANECLKRIKDEITARSGNFEIKLRPYIVGNKGEVDIENLVEKHTQKSNVASDLEEDNEEGMDVDIGFDTAELDKHEETAGLTSESEEEKVGDEF
jgi:translation initiation factor 2 subunit 1